MPELQGEGVSECTAEGVPVALADVQTLSVSVPEGLREGEGESEPLVLAVVLPVGV